MDSQFLNTERGSRRTEKDPTAVSGSYDTRKACQRQALLVSNSHTGANPPPRYFTRMFRRFPLSSQPPHLHTAAAAAHCRTARSGAPRGLIGQEFHFGIRTVYQGNGQTQVADTPPHAVIFSRYRIFEQRGHLRRVIDNAQMWIVPSMA